MRRAMWTAALCVALVGATAPARAQVPAVEVTIDGPSAVVAGPRTWFSGVVSAAGVGLPAQHVRVYVDASQAGFAVTTTGGRYEVALRLSAGAHTVQARWAAGTPAEVRSAPRAVTAGAEASGPVTSRRLIDDALDAGRIDLSTALTYRMFALFADPRLPAPYRGEADDDEDVFGQVKLAWGSLTPAARAALEPFVVRPDDPRSHWSLPSAGPTASLPRGDVGAAPPAAATPLVCTNGWMAYWNDAIPVKTWVTCTGNPDPRAATDVAAAYAIAATYWTRMTALLGTPMPDHGDADEGGDTRIDLYALQPSDSLERGWTSGAIPTGTLAVAVPDHLLDDRSSGYMMVDRTSLATDRYRSIFVHELFHILQFSHNTRGMWSVLAGSHWFGEASATWASTFFAPAESSYVHTSAFENAFQQAPGTSLQERGDHRYAAYIWPFFMQQEASEQSIARAWTAIEGKETFSGIDQAISSVLPFDTRFKDFAVRNLNESPTLDDAKEKHYAQQDPTFPYPSSSNVAISAERAVVARPRPVPVSIAPLAARYSWHEVDTANVHFVKIDARQIQAQADVDVLVKVKGKPWERRSATGRVLTFCRDEADQDIEGFWLVIANHSMTLPAGGSYEVDARPECVDKITGTFTDRFTAHLQATSPGLGVTDMDQTIRADVKLKLTPEGQWRDDGGTWHLEGSLRTLVVVGACVYSQTDTYSGDGTFAAGAAGAEGTGRMGIEIRRDSNGVPDTLAIDADIVGHLKRQENNCGVPRPEVNQKYQESPYACDRTKKIVGTITRTSEREWTVDMRCEQDYDPPERFSGGGHRSITGAPLNAVRARN